MLISARTETMSTSGDDTSAAPTVEPRPVMTEYVPFGGSAASSDAVQSSAMRAQVSGVTSEDFTTTVLPVTKAGASLRAITNTGKFQGQIPTETPSGILCR